MKKTLPALAIALMLTGCQSLNLASQPESNQPEQDAAKASPAPDAAVAAKPAEPALPPPPTDVWERIRSQMAMDVPDNARVERFR